MTGIVMTRHSRAKKQGSLRATPLAAGNGAARSEKPRKADQAYRQLKDMILALDLEPGQSLDERELMDRLMIGRTPLREAIQRLAHERLVRVEPRRGSWVSELSLSELHEMMAARELVEPAISAMAATRVSEEQAAQLGDLVMATSRAMDQKDVSLAVTLDRQFHRDLAKVGGNSYLATIVDQINTAMLRYWHVSFRWGGDLGPGAAHHHTLLERVLSRDPEAAAAEMRAHITIFRERMMHALESQADLHQPFGFVGAPKGELADDE